jgi:dTDP-4-dehydrorhamnose 3,5-epimerase
MPKFTASSLALPEVLVIAPRRIADPRGYFVETYHATDFAELGIHCVFVQDNQSSSPATGTVRGLHFQNPPKSQAKLVRVLRGRIFDVTVDIRRGSASYGRWCSATISADGGEQVFVPHGFAHGFSTLEPNTDVAYKVDNYYAPECDAGILWNDPTLEIVWPIAAGKAVVSEKDARLPRFETFKSPFQVTSA